jgi:GNAT superfamily N-acetyltransferase
MLDDGAVSIATKYWAAHFGCEPADLFSDPFRIVLHGSVLADYRGIFGLFRDDAAIVSVPANRTGTLRPLLSGLPHNCSPGAIASALHPVAAAIIGPAFIGYATNVALPTKPASTLTPNDAPALDALQQACDPTEWEHGGSPGGNPCSGAFVNGRLVAVAGYEIWGGTITHISVVTHPGFRGRDFGRNAVAHLAARALSAGLLPQYRTLESNRASIRVAQALGFCCYARSIAVRLNNAI